MTTSPKIPVVLGTLALYRFEYGPAGVDFPECFSPSRGVAVPVRRRDYPSGPS
jgi:hypothetical protein